MRRMTDSTPRVSGIILAGGQSRRMGRDKAFIELNGKPIVAHVLETMQRICAETIIVANDAQTYARFSVPIVGDVFPDKGSLGGIYSGLRAAREEYVVAVACDMPFLSPDLLRFMISLASQFDVVIPQASSPSGKTPRGARAENFRAKTTPQPNQALAKERDLHPMHAIYSKQCLAPMEEKIRADDLRLIGFFDNVRVRTVESAEVDRFDPGHWSFFNVNTPEDLQIAERR
jgi:molybdopterin-guanine dinucleotide biosynthesis protein A